MKFSDFLTLFRQVTSRREWPFVLFVLIGSLSMGWLLRYDSDPKPVRVPGTTIALRLECIPANAQVRVLGTTAGTPIASAQFFNAEGKPRAPRIDYDVRREVTTGFVELSLTVPARLRAQLIKQTADAWATLELHFTRATHIDLLQLSGDAKTQSSSCPFDPLVETRLNNALLVSGSKILHFRFMQDVVSDLALALNEAVGNFLLAAMILAVLWITYHLIVGFTLTYFATEDTWRKRISDRKKRVRATGVHDKMPDVILADFMSLERRLAFARTVGSGLGFLLTVSSIIAALHPAVQAEQDAFRFITSLQLAMTATLVGLLIRIAAEFAIRLHRSAIVRSREFTPSD